VCKNDKLSVQKSAVCQNLFTCVVDIRPEMHINLSHELHFYHPSGFQMQMAFTSRSPPHKSSLLCIRYI